MNGLGVVILNVIVNNYVFGVVASQEERLIK
jgi:hypothetical protein